MAKPIQNTEINSMDSILIQADEGSSPVVSVFSRVVGSVTGGWLNLRWASALKRREEDLTRRSAEFDKNSLELAEQKAVLSGQRKALKAMALELKERKVSLQCAKDTFRAERQVLRVETIEEAKVAAQSECAAIYQRSVQKLISINVKIEQREVELFALEAKLRNLQEMLAGVSETLDVGLKECTRENKDAVTSQSMHGKPMYLVPTIVNEDITMSLVANQKSTDIEMAGWTASLFPAEEHKMSSSAVIASAACLRVGG